MKARLLGPRMFLADGCTAMSSVLVSLKENTRREMSVSVTMTMNLPRRLLYVMPGFWNLRPGIQQQQRWCQDVEAVQHCTVRGWDVGFPTLTPRTPQKRVGTHSRWRSQKPKGSSTISTMQPSTGTTKRGPASAPLPAFRLEGGEMQ